MKNVNEMIRGIGRLLPEAVDLLYPPICPFCGGILAGEEARAAGTHRACFARARRAREPLCKKCGKPVLLYEQEYCSDCARHTRSFESGHGLWLYEPVTAGAIFLYKYKGRQELAPFFGRALLHYYGDWMAGLDADALIPVPISRARYGHRGFNQAALLAGQLSGPLGLPVLEGAILRTGRTLPQKALGSRQRYANLAGAFTARPERLKGIRRVLLVDDIYTTGSTIEAVTRTLLEAGVEKVWFISLCIGRQD